MSELPSNPIANLGEYLEKQWSLVPQIPTFSPVELQNEQVFFKALQERIQYLMNHNFEFLIQLLYRLDVPEKALKQSIQTNGPQEAAATITSAIIEREHKRILTRNANNTDNWSFEN